MLTKEERAAIAARVASYDGGILTWTNLYECLLDAPITGDVSIEEDSKYVIDCLIDLCDTSNMIELPRDKDGEVIHIGDTVFDDYDGKWVVNGIDFKSNGVLIDTYFDGESTKFLPYELTHKSPVTVQDLSERMQAVIDDYGLAVDSDLSMKLVDIADQLKELAGKDD